MTKTSDCKACDTSHLGQLKDSPKESKCPRIGLALSGGGFRASLFHLGVIRRLEELGIMRRVDTISAVSGGSIIAAYYVIEMEKRLRRDGVCRGNASEVAKARLSIFKEIAECFCDALDKNMRSRAFVFSPFYHPILFLKSLWPTCSRSDILQKEYDKWFYFDETLDHLPVLSCIGGPKVILNATSLLTGQRRSFLRRPVSGLSELGRINANVLRLSRVVGASSGMPGAFPPTTISGDVLVDGGVSDNQGIEALVNLDRELKPGECYESRGDDDTCGRDDTCGCDETRECDEVRGYEERRCGASPTCVAEDFDVLLVSDASGQLELAHRIGRRSIKVLARTVSVLQYQLRRKVINLLRDWKCHGTGKREFAFVHLFLNLKDRRIRHRVPSEYIPALGRIRTDLDQFSHIEREALMYHGYTLIDAQIRKHCKSLWKHRCKHFWRVQVCMGCPPLFRSAENQSGIVESCNSEIPLRKRVKQVLKAGSRRFFLIRSRNKYPGKSWWIFGPSIVVLLGGLGVVRWGREWLYIWVFSPIVDLLGSTMPGWVERLGVFLFGGTAVSVGGAVVPVIVASLLWSYLVLFCTYEAMRWAVCRWDGSDYWALTGEEPGVKWGTCGENCDRTSKRQDSASCGDGE